MAKQAIRKRAAKGKPVRGADLLVECLQLHGVEHIFGIPGAKVDAVFDALLDSGPELVVCRHEQNAAFMAAAVGRLTGNPGVCLVTSGPGVSNLATGLSTATSEGDPVVALAGSVPRGMQLKRTHQGLEAADLLRPVTKYSVQVGDGDSIPEAVSNAFRISRITWPGASFVSLPQDVLTDPVQAHPIPALPPLQPGPAFRGRVEEAAELINRARMPVLLVGLNASIPSVTRSIRKLLQIVPFPVVGTFQASGVLSRSLLNCWLGRVGLFQNQPGTGSLRRRTLLCVSVSILSNMIP